MNYLLLVFLFFGLGLREAGARRWDDYAQRTFTISSKGQNKTFRSKGIFVSKDGHAVIARHAIEGIHANHLDLIATTSYGDYPVGQILICGDQYNDLCLIKIKVSKVVAYFPLSAATFTPDMALETNHYSACSHQSIVTSSGLQVEKQEASRPIRTRYILIDRQLCPGDSGGPVFTAQGSIVGMLSRKLDNGPKTAIAISALEIRDLFLKL